MISDLLLREFIKISVSWEDGVFVIELCSVLFMLCMENFSSVCLSACLSVRRPVGLVPTCITQWPIADI